MYRINGTHIHYLPVGTFQLMKMASTKCIVLSVVEMLKNIQLMFSHVTSMQLTKDEDIEYRSGTLYSSSGTTFVEILTFSQGTQQQFADEEEPTNLTDSNTFTVNGSYTLDRMQCYTLSKSAAAQRNGRSVENMVVTSLKATVNRREYLCTQFACQQL